MKKTHIINRIPALGICLCAVMVSGSNITRAVAKVSPTQPPPGATPQEIEKGNKAAEEFEKSPKVKLLDGSKNPAHKVLLDKLNRMATELGKVSARPQIKYTIKVVDDEDLNAFTLPNGHIYMFRGLVEAVASDDELAAVVAHEIAHNAKMHALRAEAKAKKLTLPQLASLVALLTGGRTGANLAQFTQYLLIGVMNGYSVEFEKEADKAAIDEMIKAKYNPSAIVTLMNRLEQEEKRRPEIKLGIFQTHPTSEERASAAIADIMAAGLTFNPRDVQGGAQAVVMETADRIAIKLDAVTLIEFAPQAQQAVTPKSPTVKERAQQAATQLNQLLRANLKMHEVTITGDETGARLLARGAEIARVTPADAKLQNLTPLQCAEKWRDNFRRIFWKERINGKL